MQTYWGLPMNHLHWECATSSDFLKPRAKQITLSGRGKGCRGYA
jgi:hypothetical protein